MVLSVPGVDYESLDRSEQEYAVKRSEAALKAFGPEFHVYQNLFKSNRPEIPFAKYDDPIVEAAIEQRRKFFEAKRDHLYQVEIFYCILLEGARSKTGVGTALARLARDPEGAIAELKSQFTNDSVKKLLRTHIERDLQRLDHEIRKLPSECLNVRAVRRSMRKPSTNLFKKARALNRHYIFCLLDPECEFRRRLRSKGKNLPTTGVRFRCVPPQLEMERTFLR
jgi:type IV secretory pathway VirB4 component